MVIAAGGKATAYTVDVSEHAQVEAVRAWFANAMAACSFPSAAATSS